ncbi:glycosyltransferase family 39 protein [Hymenobacter weizhouensis]|uniref:glycosyltransferase family 39 protein n=1 Tax=Hymenobacter sp. YIM 151500-1 TaxID=2987689 RepID=UPI002225D271|nr:glycosyltransferase family 39 protein [Hymenobacter sp. YIM 151500-1]UYZ63064.1 glycosyltransferase family 39 protein [Hymenobacter sp. YIM 151500-1]
MHRKAARFNRYTLAYAFLVFLVISVGVCIRTVHFPDIPPGFSQDEANSAYESFSLATTGRDRWGNKLPVYFPSWGSGQNVLQAYLSIPFIKAFGLTVFSARLPALLLGILTLPLFFFCLRPFGRYPAFLGLLLLTLVPWHFMLSRWSLESNIAPFFMLLGCTMLTQALIRNQARWIIPCVLPFALSLHAYGTTIIILPILFSAVLLIHRRIIYSRLGCWILAFTLFFILAFPFLLFFTEHYILEHNLAWADRLFFSTPPLASTRLSQIRPAGWLETVQSNVYFIRSVFSDGTVNHVLYGHKTLLRFTLPLILLGPLAAAYQLIKRQAQGRFTPEDVVLSVFFIWAAASLSFIFLFNLNVNRFNHFYLPCLALCAWVVQFIIQNIRPGMQRQAARFIVAGVLIWEGSSAVRSYFTEYPQGRIKDRFNVGLEEAFASASELTGVNQIIISRQVPLPDVYTLFYLKYPPEKFRQEVDVEISNGEYKVNKFGKYVFYDDCLNSAADYGYVSRIHTLPSSTRHRKEVIYTNELWEVGIMRVKTQ